MEIIKQPDDEIRAGDWVINRLKSEKFNRLSVAVAFVKTSGVSRIEEALGGFIGNGGKVRFAVGVDHRGTSKEGLRSLMNLIGASNEIWVVHNTDRRETPTFHPKVYLFESDEFAEVLIGSNNLTKGGLFTNYEASVSSLLHRTNLDEKEIWEKLQSTFDDWCRETDISKRLNDEVLARLWDENKLGSEQDEQTERSKGRSRASSDKTDEETSSEKTPLFGGVRIRPAPRPAASIIPIEESDVAESEEEIESLEFPAQRWFGITVLEGDLPQAGSPLCLSIV